MVFWYSARFNRRITTCRPVFLRASAARRNSFVNQATSTRRSPAGRGSSLSGGISPRLSISRASCQVSPALPFTISGSSESSLRSPFCFSGPWQEKQCFRNNGLTSFSKPVLTTTADGRASAFLVNPSSLRINPSLFETGSAARSVGSAGPARANKPDPRRQAEILRGFTSVILRKATA